MSAFPAELTPFAQRTQQYLALAASQSSSWYSPSGEWIATSAPAVTRERFWYCFSLYANGQALLADQIIRQSPLAQSDGVYFDIFETNIACALLMQHRNKMAADVRAKLELPVRDGFTFKADRRPDYQFHGYNDNMPAKATMGLVLGGELLDNPEAVAHGLWNLRRFHDQMQRNGSNSEYNSPTYSPLTIHAIAEIASFARNEEARRLALAIEEMLWLDTAHRFHPEMGLVAGPHSRAYTCDTLGHLSIMASLLWFVLGDCVKPSPLQLFETQSGLVLHHQGDVPFNVAQMCWLAAGHYHVPDSATRLFGAKNYPHRHRSSSEQGDAGPDMPARLVHTQTHLAQDFTLGTVSSQFVGGEQTMSYFVTYKRQTEVRSFRDVGTIFSKLVINDAAPGFVPPSKYSNSGEQDNLDSRANTIALQSDTTALVLTHPHLALGGINEGGPRDCAATPLHRLSELLIVPAHFGEVEEIWSGGKLKSEWSGEVPAGQWLAFRTGRLYLGFYSLARTENDGLAPLTLETIYRYQVLRATFYAGQPRTFTRHELRRVFGGFLAEHASVDDFGSLEEFAASLQEARVQDYFWVMRTVRYDRPATPARPGLHIHTAYSPGAVAPRFASITDGAVPEEQFPYPGGLLPQFGINS